MTKSVTTKYNFWLGGYYDDFASARCVADDLNSANIRTLDHTKTHFGSAIGDNARLNSRFKFSLPERTRTGAYFLSAPNIGSFTHLNSNITSTTSVTDALTHNTSLAEWLKYDRFRDTESRTLSQSKAKHPNSVLANRQRYGEVAGDSYLAFFNGHDTSGKYYCPVGEIDFGYSASPLSQGNMVLDGASTISPHAGSPIPFLQRGDGTGNTTTPFGNLPERAHRKIALVSFASVYMSEAPNTDASDTRPDRYTYPIKSPSGNNFFIHNQYIPRGITTGSGSAPDTTTGTERVITYDGPLRIKGIGESFHLRMRTDLPTTDLAVTYTLKIGYKGTTTYDKSADAFADTTSIVTITIDTALFPSTTNTQWEAGLPDQVPERSSWSDIEVVFDFSNNTYKAYMDGNTSHFDSGSVNTSVDELTAIGWSLDMNWTFQSVYYGNVITMIDRAAMALPLTNKFDGSIPAPVSDFTMTTGANKISSARLTVADDTNSYNLASITTGIAASEWKMICFLDNEDRPFWQGVINRITHKQSHKNQILDTTITANDSFSILDRTLPIWELGQNAYISLDSHISMASVVEKRVHETSAISDTLLMGAARMGFKGTELGYNMYDTDTYSGGFSTISDGRMQLYSGSPIQMYINEDEDGPNDSEDEWEGDDVMQIVAHHPKQVEREFWVKFDERLYTTTPSHALHIDNYNNLSDGDSIVVIGTAYDDVYTINQMHLMRDLTTEEDTFFVRIRTTDTTGNASDNSLFEASSAVLIDGLYSHITPTSQGTKKLVEITTSGAHGLSLGDEFMFPVGLTFSATGSSGTMAHFTARKLQVHAAPSSTKLHVLVERWPYAVGDTKSVSGTTGHAYDLSKINGKDSTSYPKTHPILYKQSTITSQAPQVYSKHSRIHARWMRDLPLSTWFKAQFGVIAAEPYWRHGKGSFLDRPFNTQQASQYTSGGWNSDGTVKLDTMVGDLDVSTTNFQVRDPAIWYNVKTNRLKEFIIDLVDKDTGDHQYIIANNVTDPGTSTTLEWDGTDFHTSSAHGLVEGQIVVHTDFQQGSLNGVFMVDPIGTSNYSAFRIDRFTANTDSFAFLKAKSRGDSNWNDGISRHYEDPDAISANLNGARHTAASAETAGKVHYGLSTISGVKGVKREWKRDSTIYSLRNVDESNGYKHCFVMWADMRNDGNADADAGYRKTDFGLVLPTSQNYKVSLSFANQFDEFGLPDAFCDFKIGEDLDVWSLDATSEPFTGTAWETLEGGSNEEPFEQYQNWKDKGGAICLIDLSRFWNLNTMASGGRPGYNSGGLADFGDYETNVSGFPYLIDNYWKHAITNYKNITTSHFMQFHKNADNFINDGTVLKSPIAVGDTEIFVEDASQFQNSGYGVIQCTGGEGRDSEKTNYYFFWSGKGVQQVNNSGVVYEKLTGVYITEYEVVTGPKNVRDQLKVDQAAGESGSEVAIGSNEFLEPDDKLDSNFDTVRVFNTPAALFSFRLIMNVEGLVRSPNSGTFFLHDKLRYLQTLMLTDNWATNASLPCIFDLANVPKTSDLGGDNYGSIHDARGQTMTSIFNDIKEKDGEGLNGGLKAFSWMIDRDNRMSFRESYSSNRTFTRNDLKVSDLVTTNDGRITNVRVYYNGNSAFADHPTPSGSDIRWKVLNHPDIFNKNEALSIAKQEFHRENTARISVNAEVLRPSGDSNIMTDGGRYGYVADVCRNMVRNDGDSMGWWTNSLGGSPHFGIQNALDSAALNGSLGSISTEQVFATTYSSSQGENEPDTMAANPGLVSKANGGLIMTTLPANGLLDKVANNQFRFSYDGNTANYGPTVTVTAGAWHKLESTVSGVTYELSIWVQDISTGVPSGSPAQIFYHRASRRTGGGYHWYGTNSLTNAIQVVHVDKDTNKVSATTANELRLAIAFDSGSTKDTAVFRLFALDYSFNAIPDISGGSGNEKPPTYASTLEGSSSVQITGNGMFELALPSSYDSNTPKVIFSVDIDYLRDVLRARFSSGTPKNAHNISGDSTYSSFNTLSPFPLGMREHADLLDSCELRAALYAPRLHIVDDLNFRPATTITYTDTHADLSSETMVIKDITWTQSGNKHEKVNLKLEKLDNHYTYSMAQVFARGGGTGGTGGGGQSGTPPSNIPPFARPEGGGFGGSVPAQAQLNTVSNVNEDAQSFFSGNTSNTVSREFYRAMKGRADFAIDSGSSDATWGVPGTRKTGPSSSFDRAIDGLDSITSASGSAIATSDGFTLAGISDAEIGVQGEVHSHTINVRVPNDTSTGFVSVLASVSLQTITGGGNAEITTTVTCTETSSSISSTKIITAGSDNTNVILVPTQFLSGADTPNNTLVVTFERKPAQGNDAAGYQSLVIHNVSVNVRRYNNPTVAQNSIFKPF